MFKNKVKKCSVCENNCEFFYYNPIKESLNDMFKMEGLKESILKNKEEIKSSRFISGIFNSDSYQDLVRKFKIQDGLNLSLTLCSDGISFYNLGRSIWPIFLSINEIPITKRFEFQNILIPIIFFGKSLPSLELILQPLITELNNLFVGTIIQGEYVKCILNGCIYDLPAKAKFMFMKSYNGFQSCCQCKDMGTYLNQQKKMIFPFDFKNEQQNNTPRNQLETEAVYQNIRSGLGGGNGILGIPPLNKIVYFNSMESCITDSMHCVFINISKMMMKLLFDSKCSTKSSYIHPINQKSLSNILQRQRLPDSFLRKLGFVRFEIFCIFLFLILHNLFNT